MQHKKKTAPQRAGTKIRDVDALRLLAELRTGRPEQFDRLMVAVAQLMATIRDIGD